MVAEDVDIVIVGARPVGLLTAIELTLGGVRVLVLERLAAMNRAMKAGGIGPLGTEALQRRGIAEAFAIAEADAFAVIKKFTDKSGPDVRGKGSKFSGHFGGLSLLRKDAQKEPERRSHPVDSKQWKPCWPTALIPWESRCAASTRSQLWISKRTAWFWSDPW